MFRIFELGLIVVQTDLENFQAWPYYRSPVFFDTTSNK